MNLIKIGLIRTTHGIKGELKVSGDNPVFRDGFTKDLYINTNPMTKVHIKHVGKQKDYLLVSFKEFDDINQVERFKGLDILIDKKDLDELDMDEFYISDLIGLKVYNQNDEYKGEVTDVIKLPQCYYLRVTNEDKSSLIPFIDEFILSVEDDIIVQEIEGLFNENWYNDFVSRNDWRIL